jgi:hypothetical protein
MKPLFVDIVLPLAAALTLIVVLTLALFDPVPSHAPAAEASTAVSGSAKGRQSAGPDATPSAGPSADPFEPEEGEGVLPGPPTPKKTEMNDVMARAIRVLNASRAPSDEAPAGGLDPNVAPALQKLSEAVKLARDARDDKDLARAEELMRQAREQMEASCGDPSGPLCQSAESIKDLGY